MGINDLPVDAFFSNVLYKNLTVYLSPFLKNAILMFKRPSISILCAGHK